MNFNEFSKMFVVNFISTWAANEYADACARAEHERLENPPIEDAVDLAQSAWRKLEDLGMVQFDELKEFEVETPTPDSPARDGAK